MSEAVRRFRKSCRASLTINIVTGLLTGYAFVLVREHLDSIFVNPYTTVFWAVTGITLFLLAAGSAFGWLFSLLVLRCPACSKSVVFTDSNFCPGCGIPVRDRK